MILRTLPVSSSAASPWSPLPALLFTTVRSLAPVPSQRVDQLHRLAGRAEAADQHGGAVGDVGDGVVGGVVSFEYVGHATFSSTTARPWPTPMQMAATPHRWPPSCITLARVPRMRPPEAPRG